MEEDRGLSNKDHWVSVDQTRDYVVKCTVHTPPEQLTENQNRSCPWTRFNKCFYYLFPAAQYSSTAPYGISNKILNRIKNQKFLTALDLPS